MRAHFTPSAYERALICPGQLQANSAQSQLSSQGLQPTAALLGTLVHRALETVWRMPHGQWTAAVRPSWQRVIEQVRPSVPESELRKAVERSARLVQRVADFSQSLPGTVEARPEVHLETPDGVLLGRADLVLESNSDLHLIELKSTQKPVLPCNVPEAWVRQVRLYAALLQGDRGALPRTAHVAPLIGDLIPVDINPSEVTAVESDARALLARLQHAQELPLTPSQEGCRWCRQAFSCPAPWRQSWSVEKTGLLQGVVLSVTRHGNGSISLLIEDTCWTGAQEIVRAIDPELVPDFSLEPGAKVYIRGAYRDTYRGTIGLSKLGQIAPG